jgi:predicted esterase
MPPSHRCVSNIHRVIVVAGISAAWTALRQTPALAQGATFVEKVAVSGQTRLDWVYPLLGNSPSEPPPGLLAKYASTGQSYEFFGPVDDPGGRLPLVIFVSPSDRSIGWQFWESTCRGGGVLFAGLRDMGNGRTVAQRVRATLDVLDDLRDRYEIDPDRTYLAGFSGGGHIACVVATALPEYFGGVVCVGHAPPPPQAPWQLDRVRQRLSVAILCGENDPATPLMEDLYGPWWRGAGVRVAPITVDDIGHTMPDAPLFEQAFAWMEDALSDRRAKAALRPALRIADTPSRSEWAQRQLDDAQRLLALGDPASIDAGLQQLQGLVARWPDVSAAAPAQRLIADYAARPQRPWETLRAAETLRIAELSAAGYEELAFDGRRSARSQRGSHATRAIQLWQFVKESPSADEELRNDAAERIAALERVAAEAPASTSRVPLARVRFHLEGDVTLAQGIEHMRNSLAAIGYELRVDEDGLRAAGVNLDAMRRPRIKAGTFQEVNERFFRRAGVQLRRIEGVVEIVPLRQPPIAAPANTEASGRP